MKGNVLCFYSAYIYTTCLTVYYLLQRGLITLDSTVLSIEDITKIARISNHLISKYRFMNVFAYVELNIKVSSFESNGNIYKKESGHIAQFRIMNPHH